MTAPIIGFAGMTHLGLNHAAAAVARGFVIRAFDADVALIAGLRRGELPVVEPDLPELLATQGERLVFTAETADLGACDLVYIAADVPTDDAGASDLEPIRGLIDAVVPALKADACLIVLCQVPPGFTRGLELPPARLFYQVETLIFGRAVERALNPERFILGCADPAAALPAALAGYLAAFDCPLLPMGYESAELAKLSINLCLAASISTANTLAELCEKIGADWHEIVPALRLDARIGPKAYLSPGLGIAGGNLERDLATVCRLAELHGSDAGLVRAEIANSRYRRDWVLRTLHKALFAHAPAAKLAMLGLAYKENTASTKNSPALALLAAVPQCRVRAFDPQVPVDPAYHPDLHPAPSPLAASEGADALVVMTPWPEFAELDAAALAASLAGRVIIDPYGVLDAEACRRVGLDYHTLGVAARFAAPS